jgi:hypothetical protein
VCGPALSRDGGRVAFVTWKGGRNVVIRDGEEGEEFDAISWPLALSADGKGVAYQARLGQDQYCVFGNRRSRPYRSVGLPVLSDDGSIVAFAASNDDGWRVLWNSRPGPRFDWVGNLVLHPSGRRLAYTAERREAGKLKFFTVVDGIAGPSFDRVTPPVLSGDGTTVAYAGLRDGAWSVIAGRHEVPVDGEVARVILSRDGVNVGYIVDERSHLRLISPSGAGPEFGWIGEASFLKDGRVAYLAAQGGRKYLCIEGQLLPLGSGEVSGLMPFPDGAHVGLVVREERTVEWKVIQAPGRRGSIAKE